MVPISITLLIAAIVIFSCILGNKLSSRLGIPALFVFILLGMIFGSDGIFKIPFANFQIAETVCSTALIFIMFYGGFGTNWREARPVAAKSIVLSTLGVLFTALLTGLFCWYVLGMELLEGMLIGAVLGSTDAASVFSILRSKKLNLKYGTASILELESGSNDPCAYMLTVIILTMMAGNASAGSILLMTLAQIAFGLLCGAGIAAAAIWVLRNLTFKAEGLDTIFVFSVAIFAYALPSVIGGNGYLSVYIMGIILGNSNLNNQKNLSTFFDTFNGLMQMLIFFLLGLLSFPSRLPSVLLPAVAIATFMTFAARPLVIGVLLAPFKPSLGQFAVISWAGLRGAASIVFAIMVTVNDSFAGGDIYHIVFCVVLYSIILQGTLLPILSRKVNMIDENSDVLRTFTDYVDETEVQFIQLPITPGHPWIGNAIKDLTLVPDTLLAAIQRGDKVVVPKGDTVIEENDLLILAAMGYQDTETIRLKEISITPSHRWFGKQICDVTFKKNTIIVMVKRGDRAIIPSGSTRLENGDVAVLYSQLKVAAS